MALRVRKDPRAIPEPLEPPELQALQEPLVNRESKAQQALPGQLEQQELLVLQVKRVKQALLGRLVPLELPGLQVKPELPATQARREKQAKAESCSMEHAAPLRRPQRKRSCARM